MPLELGACALHALKQLDERPNGLRGKVDHGSIRVEQVLRFVEKGLELLERFSQTWTPLPAATARRVGERQRAYFLPKSLHGPGIRFCALQKARLLAGSQRQDEANGP